MKNCVDIIRPFNEAIGGREDVQLIGGIGSAALTHPETVIVPEEKRVIAPYDLYLPQYRPDGNLRDFDALVLSYKKEKVAEVEELSEEIMGDELELSLFGLKPIVQLARMKLHPYREGLKQFLSDRYVLEEEDAGVEVAVKALFPFSVGMNLETLETWRLYIGERDPFPAPIPHPGTVVLNYLTRSISGLRPKDADKVSTIADALFKQAPDMRDWLMDGPGYEQVELARVLQKLSRKGSLAVGSTLEITPVPESLREHSAFMLSDAAPATQAAVLLASYAKARGLRTFESQEKIVTIWQRLGEKRVKKTIHND